MNSEKLITIMVLTYKNTSLLFSALDSIFMQSYSNIELIISNDGSDEFDPSIVETYCRKQMSSNIVSLLVRKNKKNMGTVKHANIVLELAKGEYVMFLAADDMYKDDTIIARFIHTFERLGEDVLVVTSQCEMRDHSMQHTLDMGLDNRRKNYIKTLEPSKLWNQLTQEYIILAYGTCYRRRLFDIVGKYDEDFFLLEDRPFFTKMSRMGVKTHYIEQISVLHRAGGVSYQSHGESRLTFELYRDFVTWYQKEIRPFRHKMTWKQRYGAFMFYMGLEMILIRNKKQPQFVLNQENAWRLRLDVSVYLFLTGLNRFKEFVIARAYRNDLLILLTLFGVLSLQLFTNPALTNTMWLKSFCLVCGIISLAGVVFFMLIRAWYKVRPFLNKFFLLFWKEEINHVND